MTTLMHYTGSLSNSAAWSVNAVALNLTLPGQTSNWTAGSGNWDAGTDWSQVGYGGGVTYDTVAQNVNLNLVFVERSRPLPTTIATIAPSGAAAAVTGPAAPASVASLTIGDSGALAHSLTLQSGGPLTVAGPLTVNPSGTLNATAATVSAATLNISGGTVALGIPGSAAAVVNLGGGTLAATAGNELAVSNKLVDGALLISAGANPFKVGGSNVVGNIDKLVLPAGTTTISKPTLAGSISLGNSGQAYQSAANANTYSYSVTTSGGTNAALVVALAWRKPARRFSPAMRPS